MLSIGLTKQFGIIKDETMLEKRAIKSLLAIKDAEISPDGYIFVSKFQNKIRKIC